MGNIISDIVANKGKTITAMGENVFLIHFAPEADKWRIMSSVCGNIDGSHLVLLTVGKKWGCSKNLNLTANSLASWAFLVIFMEHPPSPLSLFFFSGVSDGDESHSPCCGILLIYTSKRKTLNQQSKLKFQLQLQGILLPRNSHLFQL